VAGSDTLAAISLLCPELSPPMLGSLARAHLPETQFQRSPGLGKPTVSTQSKQSSHCPGPRWRFGLLGSAGIGARSSAGSGAAATTLGFSSDGDAAVGLGGADAQEKAKRNTNGERESVRFSIGGIPFADPCQPDHPKAIFVPPSLASSGSE
jgi:hypothetical protein